jgi:hypothetical protein
MSDLTKRRVPGGLLLAIIFLLFGVCLNTTMAQVIEPKANEATYNWKSGEEASQLLLSQVNVLTQQLPGLDEGTPLHDNTLRRIAYFKAIALEINRGATVAQSMELALPAAATLGFSKEATYTPKITLKALHSETRVLLTN